MKSKFEKLFTGLVLGMAFVLSLSMTVLAAKKEVRAVSWDNYSSDRAVAGWEYDLKDGEKTPTFYVTLYRGKEVRMSNVISTKEYMFDFSSIIVDKGTGRYYVKVRVSGSEETVKSEELIVDGTMIDAIKVRIKKENETLEFSPGTYGWVQFPNGTWKYRNDDGKWAVGWLLWNGKWYYLADNGLMLTGWQAINNRMYCFDDSGALYQNTVTPDGTAVNADGVAVHDGIPYDASWQPRNNEKTSSKVLTLLESIKIVSNESKAQTYVVRPMRVTSNGKFSVETYSFSKPYEQWVAGQPIYVTCKISAYTGYSFANDMKVTFNRGTLVSNTGDALERTIVYTYYPRYVIDTPANIYLDNANVLHWASVKDANRYVLSVVENGYCEGDLFLKTTQYDLSDFLDTGHDIGIRLVAIAPESLRNYHYDSFEAVIDDVETIRDKKGTITSEGSRIRYIDEEGNRAEGWAQINGYWYHFTKGLSEKPGWFLDSDCYWYYFDNASRMMTGDVTDGGKVYFLNDGSVQDVPLGAWVEGR